MKLQLKNNETIEFKTSSIIKLMFLTTLFTFFIYLIIAGLTFIVFYTGLLK
jgi:hypothetical protein